MKKRKLEVTSGEILYGDQAHLLYDVLYKKGYTVEQYLQDNLSSKKSVNRYKKLKLTSQSIKKPRFIIKIFYSKNKGSELYTGEYSFQTSKQVMDFIRWCDDVGISHGIP